MPKRSPDLPETFDNQLTPLDELVVEHFPVEEEPFDTFILDDFPLPFEDADQP